MDKLAMMSILFATVALPALAARDRNPRRGLRWLLLALLVFNLAYVLYVTRLHTLGTPPAGRNY